MRPPSAQRNRPARRAAREEPAGLLANAMIGSVLMPAGRRRDEARAEAACSSRLNADARLAQR